MIEKIEIEISSTGHITNCYLLYNKNKEAVLIDPADKSDIIIKKIEELNLTLKYILLTHAHADHTRAICDIISKYKVKVIANEKEKDMILGNINDCSDVFNLQQIEYKEEDFIFLKDNDSISLDDMKIIMIHTPGHTIGSACYYVENQNILITGDTLFSNCFGRCDLDTASIDDMVRSLVKLYKNYKEVYIFPGHDRSKILIEDTYDTVKRLLIHVQGIDLDYYIN